MIVQRSQRPICGGVRVEGIPETSAHRASYVVAFSRRPGKEAISTEPRSTLNPSCPSWAWTSPAFGVRLHDGFAAERTRLDRKGIQEKEDSVITTRPPKRGRSSHGDFVAP